MLQTATCNTVRSTLNVLKVEAFQNDCVCVCPRSGHTRRRNITHKCKMPDTRTEHEMEFVSILNGPFVERFTWSIYLLILVAARLATKSRSRRKIRKTKFMFDKSINWTIHYFQLLPQPPKIKRVLHSQTHTKYARKLIEPWMCVSNWCSSHSAHEN